MLLTSPPRHRTLFFCALVMSGLMTAFVLSLISWKSAGRSSGHATGSRSTENKEDKRSTGSRSVRILCWIMTDPFDLDVRVIHVKNTWASRCDVTLFFSSQTNKTFPTIGLDVPPGKDNIAVKSRESWTYVFRHHLHEADYFVKADPDTYLLVQNLRQYLWHCDPEEPEVFGHRLFYRNLTYFAGAAIVLSRESLRRLVTVGYAKYKHYIDQGKAEDLKNAMCLHKVGARFVDTRDVEGRETFLPFTPCHHLFPSQIYMPDWYKRYRHGDIPTGRQCCSDRPVAFHYVKPIEMYSFDYLIHISDGFSGEKQTEEGKEEQLHHQQLLEQQDQSHPNRKTFMFQGTKNKKN